MTESAADGSEQLVVDAGPLLCLGGARVLRTAVITKWRGRACWVVAVRDELVNLARRGGGFRRTAAATMTGTRNQWLGAPVTFGPGDRANLHAVHQRVRALDDAARQRRGDRSPVHPDAHAGEVQSIVHASRSASHFVSHDEGARKVAKERRVRTRTIVDLARLLVHETRSDATALARDLITLQTRAIDTGEHITGAQDLFPRMSRRSK